MTNEQSNRPALRFDHREITVIFCLFIFVSLLMFTVGILVGKGLAQARYEGAMLGNPSQARLTASAPAAAGEAAGTASTAVSEGETASGAAAAVGSGAPDTTVAATDAPEKNPAPATAEGETSPPLKLIPEHPHHSELSGASLQEPESGMSAEDVLKNPKIRALIEKETGNAPRATASVPKAAAKPALKAPLGIAKGAFTVQVGSYPTKEDAEQRVAQLKKLGFPYAYFSAKELGDKKDTWYRVWLGYFPDSQAAEKSGRALQERGEVKNYLVRKTDNAG